MTRHSLLFGAGAVLAAAAVVLLVVQPDAAPARAIDGATVFANKGCATCHDGPDSVAPIAVGPSLDGAAVWAADRMDGVTADDYVRQSIDEPGAFLSPAWSGGGESGAASPMPVLALDDDELDAVVSYLLADEPG